jgi:ABC-type phosphate transport system substrate-binding protein
LEGSIISPGPEDLGHPLATADWTTQLPEGWSEIDKRPDTGTSFSDDKKDDKKGDDSATATSKPQPGKLVVVVSKENPVDSLSMDELRRIFLRQVTNWKDGEAVSVFERPSDSPIGREFSQRVLKKTAEELKTYWMELQVTRGMKPPKVLRSANMVKEYLQRVRGGIGYIHENEVDESVKVVKIPELEDGHGP